MSREKISLSVVIPCKNEEKHIERCLSSVLKQTEKVPGAEVMLVDSNSTDGSVKKAASFDIKIISARPYWVSTSSAARFLGILNTQGQYILVIDADMELLDGFLEKALLFMEENKDVAGVAGICREIQVTDNNELIGERENFYKRDTEKISEADYLGGAALFRRSCLEPEGGFNPYLYSQEELELCQRLKKKWKLVTLPYPMSVHYTYPGKSMKLFKRQLYSNRFMGMGQLLRYSIGTQFFRDNFSRFNKLIFFTILNLAIISSIPILALKKSAAFLVYEAAAIISFYIYLVIRKRSFKQAFLTAVKWLCITFTFVKGVFMKPRLAQDYPRDVIIVKR